MLWIDYQHEERRTPEYGTNTGRPLLQRLLQQFPFRILGFHSDNGSEFINHTVGVEGPLNIEQGDPLAIDFKALATARLNLCRPGDLNESCHSHFLAAFCPFTRWGALYPGKQPAVPKSG